MRRTAPSTPAPRVVTASVVGRPRCRRVVIDRLPQLDQHAKGGARRKWFERGEMIKLARKLLTQPMTQADLVRGLSTVKGYDKGLPAAEKARFKSAAYQAIAAALTGKQLYRNTRCRNKTRHLPGCRYRIKRRPMDIP